MKLAHGGQVGGETFAVSGFQLLDEQLHVGLDDFFRGLGLRCGGKGGEVVLVVVLGGGVAVHGGFSLCWIWL